jgi:hypothetical protein
MTLGPFTLLYENGFVRYLRLGDTEVLRMLYFALRDENWGTFEPLLSDERIEQTADGFRIRYTVRHEAKGTELFRWQAELRGRASGELTFEIWGEALQIFQRNRAGFCVLHPIRGTVGQPVTLTHPDGSRTEREFPRLISPHQPFFEIRAMRWPVAEGVWAELEFEGDIFETEDQRNWTDTSFKTYCTPLRIPIPVTLQPGDTVHQKLTLRFHGPGVAALAPASTAGSTPEVRVTVDETTGVPFPKIGAVHAAGQPLPTGAELDGLRALGFDHLRVDLNFTRPDWPGTLASGGAEARALGVPLELALTFGPEPERDWAEFRAEPLDVPLSHVVLFSTERRATPDDLLDRLLPLVRAAFPGVPVGAGSDIHFTDLNRNRFEFGRVDFVSYAVNPQIHAFDDRSLVENLEAQADTVWSAQAFVGDRPLHVSPLTLRPRFNPEARGELVDDPSVLPFDVDARQGSAFAAAWLLGSLKQWSEKGVARVTAFETHGPKGYLLGANDAGHPRFPAQVGRFPAYEVLHRVRAFAPVDVLRSESSQPLAVSSWVLRKPGETALVLINHTPEAQAVRLGERVVRLAGYAVQWALRFKP